MFPTNRSLRPVVKHVRDGGVLWFAPDQQTRRGESVFVPFFGKPAWTLTSTHQMARLTGAAVLPLFHRRRDDGTYEIEIGAPLDGFPTTDAVADTARVMAVLEALVRREPAQYLWIHARFKKQPEGETGPYLEERLQPRRFLNTPRIARAAPRPPPARATQNGQRSKVT
jgi:KDO2-lipid IV(A) lauroyltransferase